ncbi:MAG: hypothetical protein EOP51_24620 [Sphingobacteriales bacterium]|nr:MAG: hypothetical protein EOP51_24620 [Sphingobacteriales bacterium]
MAPFNIPVLGKYGVPHTTFASNYQLFYQKGLVRRESFTNSITYDFFETPNKRHTITPISIEFSRGTIDPAARELLLSKNRLSYIKLIGRTIFTSGSQYTYQVNANRLNSQGDFTYFRGSLDVGGNTLALLSRLFNTKKDTLGNRTFFGYNFAQYTKAEIDLRIYRSFSHERQLVFRISPGIGVPYGNSDELIFEKNFYAGGANDMRAWLPRTLGPGQFNRASYGPSDSITRARLKYIDQFGEIKIIGNLEFRYKLADNFFGSKLKGALFADFGNVWRLGKHTEENPGGEFKLNRIWQSTAIGIGTGLRFDLTFFVFRFDVAFKLKDPQFSGADQWVLIKHADELFKTGDFKRNYRIDNSTGINYSKDKDGRLVSKIVGDGYSFMQLNFGVGLPF